MTLERRLRRMLSQYFAQYLLNHHLLTAQQVRELLDAESKHHVKLGVLAMSQNLMTAEQVEEVHHLQVSCDRLFGEVAIDEGYLTESQVKTLLHAQDSGNLNLGQAIIDKNIMSLSQLEKVIQDYKKNSNMALADALSLIELSKIDFSEIEEVRELYTEYTDLFLRSVLRFMDTAAVVDPHAQSVPTDQKTVVVSQRLMGDVILTTGILADETVFLEMARRYSQEDITEINELAIDSVSEFLNVTNGLFLVNLSNRHLDVDLEPQKFARNEVPFGNKQAIIHVNTRFGGFELIIAADEIIF